MMDKKSSKWMITILLSLATLIGCDCGNKPFKKDKSPKKQAPQADKNNLKQCEIDYQPPRHTSKASDTPDTTPSKEAGTQLINLMKLKESLVKLRKR
jgi:hypothetical protein